MMIRRRKQTQRFKPFKIKVAWCF